MKLKSCGRFVSRRWLARAFVMILIISLAGLLGNQILRKRVHLWQNCRWGWNGTLSLQPVLTWFTDPLIADDLEEITSENVSDLVLLADLIGSGQAVDGIAVSPDSSTLIVGNTVTYKGGSGTRLRTCGNVWVWDIGSANNPAVVFVPSEITGIRRVGFSPDGADFYVKEFRFTDIHPSTWHMIGEFFMGRTLPVVGTTHSIQYRIWETSTLAERGVDVAEVIPTFTYDGTTYGSIRARRVSERYDNRQVLLQDAHTGEELMVLDRKPHSEEPFGFQEVVENIVFSSNGKYLIIAIAVDPMWHYYSTVQIWGVPKNR